MMNDACSWTALTSHQCHWRAGKFDNEAVAMTAICMTHLSKFGSHGSSIPVKSVNKVGFATGSIESCI